MLQLSQKLLRNAVIKLYKRKDTDTVKTINVSKIKLDYNLIQLRFI